VSVLKGFFDVSGNYLSLLVCDQKERPWNKTRGAVHWLWRGCLCMHQETPALFPGLPTVQFLFPYSMKQPISWEYFSHEWRQCLLASMHSWFWTI